MSENKLKLSFKNVQEGFPDYIKIISEIPDEIIYNFYLGFHPSLSKKFKSPFREEKDPSFCFYIKNSKIFFKCFSSGKQGDSVELIKQMYSLEYVDAIKKICKDIKSMSINNLTINYKKLDKNDTIKSIIEIIPRDFRESDYLYWQQYYITKQLLKKYDIRPCKEVWLNNKLFYIDNIKDPCYRFRLVNLYKIYCPVTSNKKKKWLSNFDLNTIQGFTQLKYNSTLIITKSYKDVIILNEFYNKSAIALNSEGNHIPDKILSWLKSKFHNIIFFYDNDKAGLEYMKRNKELYRFEYFYLKEYLLEQNIKDISDYIKQFGVLPINEIKEDLVYSNENIKNLI